MPKHDVPYDLGNIPVHRLDVPQTRCWMMGGTLRAQMADQLAKKYPSGVGVLECALQLIAYVLPDDRVRELPPPFKRYHMHEIANRLSEKECICAHYFDPESQGEWKDSGKPGHHPLCQFRPEAAGAYAHLLELYHRQDPEFKRPDAWDRAGKFAREKRGERK